jgi:hypothetical protein
MPASAMTSSAHDERLAAINHSTHGQFRLLRHPDLAHQNEIERSLEGGRNLGRNRNTTTWESQHDDLPILVTGKGCSKLLPRLPPIPETDGFLP